MLSQHTDLTLAIVPQDRQALKSIQARLPDVSVVGYRIGEWDTLEKHVAGTEVVLASSFTIGYMPQFLDYEAALVGLFPVAFRPSTLELSERVRAGERPPDVLVFGWR